VPRTWTCVVFWIAALMLSARGVQAAARPSEKLFPNTTKGFAVLADVKQLVEQWKQTQLGQLMADPVMEPFAADLRARFEGRLSGLRERLGLTLDDLRDVAGGEVAAGVILSSPDKASLALVVDVTDHVPNADALLQKIAKTLAERGAKQTALRVAECADPVVRFDVPKPRNEPEGQPRQVYYCRTGNMLASASDLDVLRGILLRLQADRGDSLADVPAFRTVIGRCAKDAGGAMPQIRWFIDPLGYAETIRIATPPQDRRKGKSIVEVLHNQGLGAVRGVGGFVSFASEGYELIHRTSVFAPPPYKKAMKMAVFPTGHKDAAGTWIPNDFTPQPWVPRDVATYATFYLDVLNAFDNFGPLFDELFGGEELLFRCGVEGQRELQAGNFPTVFREEFKKLRIALSPQPALATRKADSIWEIKDGGETYVARKKDGELRVYLEYTGIWDEVLEGLRTQEDGPKIDLREELVRHLGQRVTVISDYEMPITPTSERLLYAIEALDAPQVARALEKTMRDDPTARRLEIDGHVVWEVVEEDQPEIPKVTVGAIPSLVPEEEEEEEDEELRLLPHAAVTVAKGHLLVASHLDFLKKILASGGGRQTLGSHVDFRMVDGTINGLGMTGQCVRTFSRTDEEYRPTYELIRQGKMPASETQLGRILNAVLGEGKGVIRRQRLDGTKLPDYDVVRRYLGPAGLVVGHEPDGWFLKGFTLSKGAQ